MVHSGFGAEVAKLHFQRWRKTQRILEDVVIWWEAKMGVDGVENQPNDEDQA